MRMFITSKEGVACKNASSAPGMDIGVGVNLLTGEVLAVAFESSSLIVWAMRSESVMSRSARSESATDYQR
jgi:hypothetical protein